MYCTKCGSQIAHNARFCTSCGAVVENAATAQAASLSGKWHVSRLCQGRIARWHFFTGTLLGWVPLFVLVAIWGALELLVSAGGTDGSTATVFNGILGLLITLAVILLFVYQYMLMIRRCHDIGHSGWFGLLTFIPYVGFVFGLYILFVRGQEEPNQYGSVPAERPLLADIFNY